ncbi:MAG: UbiA family prenyltransferase [Candidatus Thermoplasmatota archaeon]|jgi:geranylgeranylglycerol-phosphate geranylgeranyltransferase|nr:UbiA family prenyltransferase [Candidatus Thermoplasmatota archaeon]
MKKLKAIWELMRLEHGVMLFLAILIGSVISQKTIYQNIDLPLVSVLLTFFTALFLEASTFALNDYYDLEIDRINKRTDRPLVRGDISPKTALYSFYILFPLGLICSYFVNITCFVIALITALLSVLYDAKMKKIKLVGNFYIAYIMAIPFVFGGAAVLKNNIFSLENINPIIYIIALIAFLAGSGREIMKDVMDYEGDKKLGVKSLPKYIGARKSNILSAIFYITAVALSFLPFFMREFSIYYLNYPYLYLIFVTDTMLLGTALQLIFKKKANLKFYRKFTLAAIFLGLIAFLIGAFIR